MGDGGALFTNDDDLALKIRMIANHGQSKQYYHDLVGVNSRLDTIQAAILRIKLKNLDEYGALRANAARVYDVLLKDISGIITPVRIGYSNHVFHQYVLKTHEVNRDGLINYLKSVDIPCNIYYPVPLNEQKPYMDNSRGFPVTKALCQSVFALPMHTELDYEQQEFIINHIKKYFSL
jgi:dTDP-4-amino-4,6-dideoxygalactose transaminase